MLDATTLREVLEYDPATGVFRWRVKIARRIMVGSVAGSICGNKGYRVIKIYGVAYYAHALAVLYMTCELPSGLVSRNNKNNADNRWMNLIQGTRSDLACRRPPASSNKSGTKGVFWDAVANRWRVSIKRHGKTIWLGQYETLEMAKTVRKLAARHFHGEFAA